MPQINYHGNNGRKYSYFYSLTRRDDFLAQLVSFLSFVFDTVSELVEENMN